MRDGKLRGTTQQDWKKNHHHSKIKIKKKKDEKKIWKYIKAQHCVFVHIIYCVSAKENGYNMNLVGGVSLKAF